MGEIGIDETTWRTVLKANHQVELDWTGVGG